jgi:hypothetical protein
VHFVSFAALQASELPAGPGGSKCRSRSSLFSDRSWQFPGPPGVQMPPLNVPPLFRQSSSPIQAVSWSFVEVGSAHAALQVANTLAYRGVLAQLSSPLLMMQLSAPAVSWRASCRIWAPFTGTHNASVEDEASFQSVVPSAGLLSGLSIFSPQINRKSFAV